MQELSLDLIVDRTRNETSANEDLGSRISNDACAAAKIGQKKTARTVNLFVPGGQ
jgi:hypothetical protein